MALPRPDGRRRSFRRDRGERGARGRRPAVGACRLSRCEALGRTPGAFLRDPVSEEVLRRVRVEDLERVEACPLDQAREEGDGDAVDRLQDAGDVALVVAKPLGHRCWAFTEPDHALAQVGANAVLKCPIF